MTDAQSEYTRKFGAAMEEMHSKGLAQSLPLPILLLRKLGKRPLPPHYDRFWRAALVQGGFFGPFFGAFMYLFAWRNDGMSAAGAIMMSLLAGLFFGVSMSAYYRLMRSRYALTDWDKL